MKRIGLNAVLILLALLIPAGFAAGQEKKEEKHIKVVVSDKGGEKVVIDTVFSGNVKADSIKLKDGKVIYISSGNDLQKFSLTEVGEKDGKVIVSVTSDGKGEGKIIKEVKGEPIVLVKEGDGEKVFIVKEGKHISEEKGDKVMSWTAASAGEKGKVVYISDSRSGIRDGEVKYDIEVREDGSGNKTEKTSYVIAKDGMVVTIEGGSEDKVKELASFIESKLGVGKKDKSSGTETVKEETKTTVKGNKK